jgi:P pilus assembly chaperone PapD
MLAHFFEIECYMNFQRKYLFRFLVLLFCIELYGSKFAHAQATFRLSSSILIVEEGKGEATLAIKNETGGALLAVTKLQTVPENPIQRLMVSPPVARVESGDTQILRFFLVENKPFDVEQYERVSIEGVPPKQDNTVQFSVRQDIPVIIRPKGLSYEEQPWKYLHIQRNQQGVVVRNTGRYVIRMTQSMQLLPSKLEMNMPRTYILPGESLQIPAKVDVSDTVVRIKPASL